jgi:ferritin-like metal-binding protein YciE
MSAVQIRTFDDMFQTGLEYIYDAEKQLTQALPKMAQAASSPSLRQAFEQHLQETKMHVQRIEQVCSKLGIQPSAKTNVVLQAMTQEAEGMIRNTEASPLRDAALIVAGNQVDHFEIGSYGSLRTFAELLGHNEVIPLLDQTLQEEKKADQKLTQVAQTDVNQKAAQMRGQFTTP